MERMPKTDEKIQHYFYKDNFQDGKIIFECEASNILEADKKYKEAIGKDVSKQSNIACWWEDIKTENL